MRFVVNEWLLHDLRGDNDVDAQKLALRFLIRLRDKDDFLREYLKGS